MQYIYTVLRFSKQPLDTDWSIPTRVETHVRFINVSEELLVRNSDRVRYEIEVYDNLKKEVVYRIGDLDDYLSWQEKLEKDFAWKPEARKSSSLEDNNLKTIAASQKPTLSAIPPIGILALGAAMQDGANKYGRFNWRDTTVSSSVFWDAMMRHMLMWYLGETYAEDSKINHLAHVMAGAAILLDGELTGVFNDNRDARTAEKTLQDMLSIIKNG